MEDFLSPISPRHPNAHMTDNGKPPTPPPQQQEISDDDLPEGAMEIPLPSKGVFYFPPFNGLEAIHCRPLDWRDEDILTTKAFIDDGTVFDKIVSRVILTKGFSAKNLVPVDRDTILLWLRTQALGKIMSVDYECPECDERNTASWDLESLSLPVYKDEVYEELKASGEFRIELPLSGIIVYIKIPFLEESRDTEKRLVRKKEAEKLDYDLYGTAAINLLVSRIETEEGKHIRNKNEIINYFNKKRLPLSDSRYIRRKAQEITLKYDTAQDLVCKNEKCGHVQEGVELPIIHPNFFWPDMEQ